MSRLVQLCICVIAAFVLLDYTQLKLLQSTVYGQHACRPCSVRLCGQQEHMGTLESTRSAPAEAAAAACPAAGLARLRLRSGPDNPLYRFHRDLGTKEGPLMHKWDQYFDVYHRYFQGFVGKEVHMMEIGVQSGGSLDMWKSYFGSNLRYYGVDINPYTKALFEELPNIQVFIGSQSDRAFWARMRATIPKLDILLDDGGHAMDQQITTFQEMFQHVKDGGIYMTEDCATSYWTPANSGRDFGGGLKRNGTWIEFTKDIIDEGLHADYYKGRTSLTASVISVAYFDQMVVFEKGNHANMSKIPESVGTMSMDYMPPTLPGGGLDPSVLARLKRLYKKP